MIQRNAIVEWRRSAPWKESRFLEQDMVISRAIISIFNDGYLGSKLAFRGGTAIHKLFLAPSERYSEDIDFVQVDAEPIGRVLDGIRAAMSFLGEPRTKRKASSNVLTYSFEAEEPQGAVSKLKVEINSREHVPVYPREARPFRMESQWFTGACSVLTYRFEELIGTKVRALYQRKKGRDLFDIHKALGSGTLDVAATMECYRRYMEFLGYRIPTRAEYAMNLEEKASDPNFRGDILPFLAQGADYDIDEAHETVRERILIHM